MKAAIAQINPRIGDFRKNVDRAKRAIADARAAGVSLVVFPELSVVGYTPRDLLDYPEFVSANLAAVQEIADAAQGISAICGFVEPRQERQGKPFYNSAALVRDGRIELVCRKQLLPYYDVFDEERYFEAGDSACSFTLDGKRIAITICEDIWNSERFLKRAYGVRPLERFVGQGLDLVVNLSASPFHLGKPWTRIELVREAASKLRSTVLYANQVGANDDLVFDGSSFAVGPDGQVLAVGRSFEEDLIVFEPGSRGHVDPATAWPDREEEWLHGALVLGIRDYVRKSGLSKICLGLSGGIDSSVVAALAASAVGPENVAALSLPTRYTSSASQEDAELLARRLGIELKTVAIEPLFELHQKVWQQAMGRPLSGVTLENVQPRIRMTLLMAFANEGNRLLLNTSNKSEIAAGYATLYGDSAGALSVLGDLTKGQVYALARHLNRSGELIPRRVLERPPTAELRENQTDQDSLPPYDQLDAMVRLAIEGTVGTEAWKKASIPPAEADKFSKLFAISEYKRRQLPPVLRVSTRAFGSGRRIPVVSRKAWEI